MREVLSPPMDSVFHSWYFFQIQFNLADFTRRAYGTNYVETLRVQVSWSKFCDGEYEVL